MQLSAIAIKFSPTYLMPSFVIVAIFVFFAAYFRVLAPRRGTTEWIMRATDKPRFNFTFTKHPMTRRDILPLAIILIVFGFISFFKLGDLTAPQTFMRFDKSGDSTTVMLPANTDVSQLMYYTGINSGDYKLEYSTDGLDWTLVPSANPDKHPTAMPQSYADLYKWLYADNAAFTARYIRVTSQSGNKLELGELAVLSNGQLVITQGADVLFDEQELVPDTPTYMNSMYFDEIYHGRAAQEIIRGTSIYETVHPPLGKTLISLGIQLFGMTPFGWRCVGTLFGVLMLAAIYVLFKNMFGKTEVAICGTLLLAFDFMRFTQSRIATIDTYPTFFIIMSYLFMYRYLAVPHGARLRQLAYPLFLSGLFFGLGAATKWTVIYHGVGLAIIFFLRFFADYRAFYSAGEPGIYAKRVIALIASAFAFFIVIPVVIYVLSYIPHGHAFSIVENGERHWYNLTVSGGMLWDKRFYMNIWQMNVNMYKYHAGLQATHPYQSTWYQWMLDIRPILYYSRNSGATKAVITAFTNPVITWGGLGAVFALIAKFVMTRDGKALLIVLGYLAQIVPWMLVERCVFAYHYFPSLIFLVIALAYIFNDFYDRDEISVRGVTVLARYPARTWVFGFTALTGVVFLLFYPALSGTPMSTWYSKNILKWLTSWAV
jgi:uncharacterized membrane protein (UPF0136 family)